jgi:hypothetical protein
MFLEGRDAPTTASFVEAVTRWAVVGLNRQTSSFAISDSSARELGGPRSTATRCWPYGGLSSMRVIYCRDCDKKVKKSFFGLIWTKLFTLFIAL